MATRLATGWPGFASAQPRALVLKLAPPALLQHDPCNSSSILSRISCLLSELSSHPLLFTLSNTPTAIHHRALLPLRAQQQRLSLRTRAPQWAHHVFSLPQGGRYALPRRYVGTAVDGKWRAIRTRGDEERLREGGSLRYWRRRTWIGRDFGVLALPGTRLRSLRGKVRVYPSSSRIREFIKTGERAYVRNSDGQGSSWSQ
jgi:hypothetical protein